MMKGRKYFNKGELFPTDITLIIYKLVVLNNYILINFKHIIMGCTPSKREKIQFSTISSKSGSKLRTDSRFVRPPGVPLGAVQPSFETGFPCGLL